MTNTGRPLDARARERTAALIDALRNRGREVHHEHTKEVVRESMGLSPEAHAMVSALQNRVAHLAAEVEAMRADLIASRAQIEALRESMSDHSVRVLQIVKQSMDVGQQALPREGAA